MKRFKRLLCKTDRGSVSVYLILLILPVFLFHALLVDALRMRLAARETEMALKAGLRSAMSQYHLALREYGLFALNWDASRHVSLVRDTMEFHLSGGDEDAFRLVSPRLEGDAITLMPYYSLANPVVFKRQIVQEMKIKAPIEFAWGLVDKFTRSEAVEAVNKASRYHDQAEALEEWARKRDEALDEAWKLALRLADETDAAARDALEELNRLEELAGKIGLRPADEILQTIKEIEDELDSLAEELQRLQDSLWDLRARLENLIRSGKEVAEKIKELKAQVDELEGEIRQKEQTKEDLQDQKSALEELMAHIAEYLERFLAGGMKVSLADEQVAELYRRFEGTLKEAMDYQSELIREAERWNETEGLNGELAMDISAYTNGLDMGYFAAYLADSGKLSALLHGLAERWRDADVWNVASKLDSLKADANNLREQAERYRTERNRLEEQRKLRQQEAEREAAEQEAGISSILNEIAGQLAACGSPQAYVDTYRTLEQPGGLVDKYALYLDPDHADGDPANDLNNPARLIASSKSIWKRIGEVLTDFRDSLFIHEYALDKFNDRTTGLSDSGSASGQSGKQSHVLSNQEAEYILYGFNNCWANHGAAYGEMFLVLFGIRTTEALLESPSGLNPLIAFLKAAAKGAAQASKDMGKLVQGEELPLMKRWKEVTVHYRDFLRLFMLLHGNEQRMMTRMQALVELNTGMDLTEAYTYLKSRATATVDLWFLPGIMKALNRAGFGCVVDANRCQVHATAVFAYE